MASPTKRALRLAGDLIEAVEDTVHDLDNMPFFVRPMVRRGYRKRTGRTLDEWIETARGLQSRLEAAGDEAMLSDAVGSDEALLRDLLRLAENYRTAPDRAARGMKNAPNTIELLRNAARRREAAVLDLHEALHALPD